MQKANICLKNTQWRSFDLVQQGQWSRYLEVYQNVAQATQAFNDPAPLNMNAGTSGINVFTTCAQVHPKFTANTNSGFIYTWKGLQAELGFNFFVRQAEEITKCSWNTDVAIKNITGAGASYEFTTVTTALDRWLLFGKIGISF